MNISPYAVALRFLGTEEVAGSTSNPAVLAMLRLDSKWPEDDSVPWCSAFVNYVFWILGLRRSKSLRARSWLRIGDPVELNEARRGFDVVIFKRGGGDQPGPEVIKAPGHVAFFHFYDPLANDGEGKVTVLGGNQSDKVNFSSYPASRVLGVRRIEIEEAA